LHDYVAPAGAEAVDEVRRTAAHLSGARVLHISATAYGGGVAEILHSLVALMRDAGLEANWAVIEAEPAFYDVTKKIHNALQGMPLELSATEQELFVETERRNAATMPDADLVVAHDPQTVALLALGGARGARWTWRCHIDLTAAHPSVWEFMRPFVERHDAAIFTMAQFVQPSLRMGRVEIIPPAIDPTTPKNRELPREQSAEIVRHHGFDPDGPLLVQVSRFDPWKDPLGVIDAFRLVRAEVPDVQLAMLGSLAHDDPEGVEFLERTLAHAGGEPSIRCLTNLDGIGDREVSAFQTAATVVVQKSLREGFGLVVSEGLWKRVPVIGGNCGGIPLQVIDGVNGYLVESVAECADRALTLLKDPALRDRMGAAGREHVRKNFLITRNLRDYLRLFTALRDGSPAG
ncbi:MAG: glycosyltransferase, partial [Chloroflexota bacterium]|nr:glycosyltransferase [Chloroflexota bacterium]